MARTLAQERDLRSAEKQIAARRLEEAFTNGNKLATFLRSGVKEHYGNRSLKLVEFGIQPFRRGRGSETEAPAPEPPEPEPETPPVE